MSSSVLPKILKDFCKFDKYYQSLINLSGLGMTWFSEKMHISTRCIPGFMSNLVKVSWKDSSDKVNDFECTVP